VDNRQLVDMGMDTVVLHYFVPVVAAAEDNYHMDNKPIYLNLKLR
jgi:hypothetical protein